MTGKKGMVHYDTKVKEEAVRLFIDDGYTYCEIARQLGIRKAGRIKVWVRQYRRAGIEAFTKPIGRPRKVQDEKVYIARLEMENKLLKKLQSELHKDMLAKRDIGRSTTTKKNIQ
jgi:transposase-like protein